MRLLGFQQLNSNPKLRNLSILSRVLFLSDVVIVLFAAFWFFLFTAQSFSEYVGSSFYVFHGILLLIWHTVYFLQRKTYASLIAELETKIDKSKSSNLLNL